MVGLIPQSTALTEVKTNSLSELLSKDPFKFTQQDRGLVVAALREQRVKWEASEAAAGSKPKAVKSISGAAASLISRATSDDLGL